MCSSAVQSEVEDNPLALVPLEEDAPLHAEPLEEAPLHAQPQGDAPLYAHPLEEASLLDAQPLGPSGHVGRL